MVKEFFTSTIKKVPLDLIYQVVSERTEEITTQIEELKKRQEDDFRFLVNKIDADIRSVRVEIGSVRTEIGNVRTEMGQLRNEIKGDIGQLRSEIKGEIGQLRSEVGQLNQRIDTVIQMLVNISPKN